VLPTFGKEDHVCGIAGFISNDRWKIEPDLSWMDNLVQEMEASRENTAQWEDFSQHLGRLIEKFDDVMSFGLHMELAQSRSRRKTVERLAELLELALTKISQVISEKGASEALEKLAEETRDCLWQIRQEVLGNAARAAALLPEKPEACESSRPCRFLAWAIELVMENLDRLEVRGRDSAGISVQCLITGGQESGPASDPAWLADLSGMDKTQDGVKSSVRVARPGSGQLAVTFIYKIANLVGRLGDNTSGLRKAVRSDPMLWKVAEMTGAVNISAHTRWASNGIISLSNCHPANGELFGREHDASFSDRDAQFVLNGDVDNYPQLMQEVVGDRGYGIDPSVTTDAKILPVFYRLGTAVEAAPEDRFAELMRACQGSLAVVMQHSTFPRSLFLGQKGSGQSLFIGKLIDGAILASEVYGLASYTRRSHALVGTQKGGTQVTMSFDDQGQCLLKGRFLETGEPFEIVDEPIYIHSRDIYRGTYAFYFEKEIHEASSSVRKTIKGKYRKAGGKIEFNTVGRGSLGSLLKRLKDPSLPPVRRIMVIGQGTASVAAQGVAHLIQRALAKTNVTVGSCKASEMSGFLSEQPLGDTLLIAISQSGTTTDTNRTVDVASSRGAWIHAIVNRRNSPLVAKADSHFYTSDGRDVEMAVASTKAFYSQVAAGKLVALALASELQSLPDEDIFRDIEDLERLPADIDWVLDQSEQIRLCAETYGPSSRNWAVVGNGPNKIAADEIRIKLSELCYKSIPCDITEDKKHIDLSTEPLTLVVANDLPEALVQDTAKEVAIFKAHSGKPLVFCTRGEKRFNEHAEKVIELPRAGAGLGFVLATVAGHLWGFYAAKAIDAKAEELRAVRHLFTLAMENLDSVEPNVLRSHFVALMQSVAAGQMNAALPASAVAALALYAAEMDGGSSWNAPAREAMEIGINILNKAIEEMTRPIDTIRHQAKTVTVGISRPQEALPDILLKALAELAVSPAQIREADRRLLGSVSYVISGVDGGMLYDLVKPVAPVGVGLREGAPLIRVVRKFGSSEGRASRYDQPRAAGGSKRTALRLERVVWSPGKSGAENLVLIPIFDETSGDCRGTALFHLKYVPQASLQQKTGVLRAMGDRYHEVVERLEELSNSCTLEEFLERVTPRDLMLAPVDGLILSNTC